jgi:hypothetical protein
MHGQLALVDHDAHRVDQEGRVVGGHQDDGVRGGKALPIRIRVEDFDQGLTGLARGGGLEVPQRSAGQVVIGAGSEVFFGHTAVVRLDELGRVDRRAALRAAGLRGYLLDELEAGGGNLAVHAAQSPLSLSLSPWPGLWASP